MRLRSLVPCVATLAALTLPASPAQAAPKKTCKARDGLFVVYQVHRGSSRGITCTSTFSVLFKGILAHRPPSGWRCRTPRSRDWPVVEVCDLRRGGRRTATAELHAVDDFYAAR